jgi:HEAT repeat protein
LAIVAVVATATLMAVSAAIASGVQSARTMALREHNGDAVAALIAYVDTPTHGVRERNRAVWALGQLGDPRALPILEKHFTEGPCEHQHELCRHELAKAIQLCRGGTNLTALLWQR